MKLTTVKEIYKEREKYLDKEVTVGGWVRSVRDSKTFGFIVLHDGTFFETLQVVYHDTMENFAEISKLNVGAAIIVKGTLVARRVLRQRPQHIHRWKSRFLRHPLEQHRLVKAGRACRQELNRWLHVVILHVSHTMSMKLFRFG